MLNSQLKLNGQSTSRQKPMTWSGFASPVQTGSLTLSGAKLPMWVARCEVCLMKVVRRVPNSYLHCLPLIASSLFQVVMRKPWLERAISMNGRCWKRHNLLRVGPYATSSGIIVEKMLEYMAFKLHYQDAGPKEDIPVQEYVERLPPEIVLELWVWASSCFR